MFKIFKSWQVCDWLAQWLLVIITIMLGFMDLRWLRVARRSNVGLVHISVLRLTIYCATVFSQGITYTDISYK